jgi:hypothetical protein
MFLKKRVVKSCSISPVSFSVLLEIDFVVKMDLQKTCKKIWKRREGICKKGDEHHGEIPT